MSHSASSTPALPSTPLSTQDVLGHDWPHRLLNAHAGTGKTHRLSARFLRLICAGAEPASIVASTFTRKAAGEIRERIILRLARAATQDPGSLLQLRDEAGGIGRANYTARTSAG